MWTLYLSTVGLLIAAANLSSSVATDRCDHANGKDTWKLFCQMPLKNLQIAIYYIIYTRLHTVAVTRLNLTVKFFNS